MRSLLHHSSPYAHPTPIPCHYVCFHGFHSHFPPSRLVYASHVLSTPILRPSNFSISLFRPLRPFCIYHTLSISIICFHVSYVSSTLIPSPFKPSMSLPRLPRPFSLSHDVHVSLCTHSTPPTAPHRFMLILSTPL